MSKENKVKYNDSCIKMFEFLIELYKGDVDFEWVIDHFSNGKYDGTSNTHVTINKYLNALKIFGIKVKKSHGKYSLLSPLYKIKFTSKDIKSINLLKEACSFLPDGKNKKNCEQFIKELEIRFDETAQSLTKITSTNKNFDLTFYHSKMAEQIKMCEQYCQDKQKLEIIYTNDKGNDINLIGSPVETVYKKRKICINILGNNRNRIYEIPIDAIKSIKQLPCSSNTITSPTTICYRIKNRLAKNYRLRDWEQLYTTETDGSKVIVNKNEDFTLLLNRLMRYGKECEVISPKFLKEEMLELINKTLSNYE